VELAVERITALWFLLLGASHIAAPAAWAKLFQDWRELGEQGSLLNGLLHAPLAVLIIGFHHVYTWPGVVVTITHCRLPSRCVATPKRLLLLDHTASVAPKLAGS